MRFFARKMYLLAILLSLLVTLPARTEARPPTILVSQPTTYDAEELCVAIDPTNPDRMAVGANISYLFRTITGGSSWVQSNMFSTYGVWGDPALVFDEQGVLYYAHLSNPSNGSWLDRIVVQRSFDGGDTWNNGTGVGWNGPKDQDKEWMAIDRTGGVYAGNLYMSWTEFDNYGSSSPSDSTRILFVRSTDQAESFSTPLRISDRAGNCIDDDETVEGAVPAVGPEGQIYIAWAAYEEIVFDRSLDGGQTFGADIHVASQPGGWGFDVPGIYRCNGMPVTACDISWSSYRGRVYVLFSDQRNGVFDTDVWLCHSDDEGRTWSAPQRVNDEEIQSHQFFPWLSVDPETGYLWVVYYDRRSLANASTDVYVAVSTNGGETFTNFMVSDTPFSPREDVFFGDYIGIDARGGTAYAVWMRMDDRDLSVRGVRLDPASDVAEEGRPTYRIVDLMRGTANPVGRNTRIAFTLYESVPVRLAVYDLRGRLVRSLVSESRREGSYSEAWDGTDRTGSPVPSGVYLCRLEAGQDVVTRKVSLIR